MSENIENKKSFDEVVKEQRQKSPEERRSLAKLAQEAKDAGYVDAEVGEYSPENSNVANEEFLDVQDVGNKDLQTKVYDKIKEIYDPEIPVNIYELGLIYDVGITEKNEVVVLMTLTAPNCPEAAGIPIQVEEKIKEIDGVEKVKAIITFEPPWEMSLMSEEAKLELGLL
jgi:FeS assembly SUF system protein